MPIRRRLPYIVRPVPGEAFDSWIDRCSLALGTNPGVLAEAIGITTTTPARLDAAANSSNRPAFPPLYGISLADNTLKNICAATRLEPEEVQAMHLMTLHGRGYDLAEILEHGAAWVVRVARREWLTPYATQCCSTCLAEDGAWRLSWRTALVTTCPRHQVLLVDRCRRGHLLKLEPPRRRRYLSHQRPAQPTICDAITDNGRCAEDLSAYSTFTAPPALVEITSRLLDQRLLDHGPPRPTSSTEPDAPGTRTEPSGAGAVQAPLTPEKLRSHIAAVRFVADLASLTQAIAAVTLGHQHQAAQRHLIDATRTDLKVERRGGGSTGYTDRPTSTAATAGYITALAASLLGPQDRAGNGTVARPWSSQAATDRKRASERSFYGVYTQMPALLLADVQPQWPHARVAREGYRLTKTTQLDARRVPEVLPEALAAPLYPFHSGAAPTTTRQFASLCLALLAGATTWRQAAVTIGMDPQRGVRVAETASRRTPDEARWWAAIADIAMELPDLNYPRIRLALHGIDSVDPERLDPLGRTQFMPWTRTRRRLAAVWIWDEIAHGNPEVLLQRDPGWNATPYSRSELYRRFRRKLPEATAHSLRAHGYDLIARHLPPALEGTSRDRGRTNPR